MGGGGEGGVEGSGGEGGGEGTGREGGGRVEKSLVGSFFEKICIISVQDIAFTILVQ